MDLENLIKNTIQTENEKYTQENNLLTDALSALDFIEMQSFKPEHKQQSITDYVSVVRKVLLLNKQLVEILEKANFTYLGDEYVACLKPHIVRAFLEKVR